MSIYIDLRTPATPGDVAGYHGFDGYPTAYQAAEFPKHGDQVRITGNNQAFFFAAPIKGEGGAITDIASQTKHLSTLMKNIINAGDDADSRPAVVMQIDADVIENIDRFVEKYQTMRPEAEDTRKRLLRQEASLIQTFINTGGPKEVAYDAFCDLKPGLTEKQYAAYVDEFMEKNFRLQGVQTAQPLKYATWEITSKEEGVFMARQEYKTSTDKAERPWQVGVEPELGNLAKNGYPGAQQVLEAVNFTRSLPTVDFTLGYDAPNTDIDLDTYRKRNARRNHPGLNM